MVPDCLILASASPRRTALLGDVGLRHRIVPAQVNEADEPDGGGGGCELVVANALLKAGQVADLHPQALVLGADTTVELDGRIFNKPRSPADAAAMLTALAGRTHEVHTALVFLWKQTGLAHSEVVTSQVTFYPLDAATIQRYLEEQQPYDKAGSYGIQDGGESIVKSYAGLFTNIVGLPVERVEALLRDWEMWEHFAEGKVEKH